MAIKNYSLEIPNSFLACLQNTCLSRENQPNVGPFSWFTDAWLVLPKVAMGRSAPNDGPECKVTAMAADPQPTEISPASFLKGKTLHLTLMIL